MKRLITAYFLLFGLGLSAQTSSGAGLVFSKPANVSGSSSQVENIIPINESFEEAADKNNIPHRKLTHLQNVEEGYYIITGVYSKGKNLKKAVGKLRKKDFGSGFIHNPENNLNYVYIQYHPFGLEAIDACLRLIKADGNDRWILEVANNPTTEQIVVSAEKPVQVLSEAINENEGVKENSTPQMLDAGSKKNKFVKQADAYFDKMWYAQAAELYEQALAREKKKYAYDVLQKVADAHYFNTNMEKAHKWYTVLYENYKDELSADNIFRYAHALKGTGKYGRSKRLMRLYDKKMKMESTTGNNVYARRASNEIQLDQILNTHHDFEIKNLAINSEYSDFSPMFLDSTQVVFASAKDSSIFKTRRYKWNDQPYLDLYVSKINEESRDLKQALKFSKKINTKYHEASVTFSPDNTTMYFTRNNYGKRLKRDKNGINHLKIYRSKKIESEWTEAVEVSFNSDHYSTGHPALSPDGKKLYFVSDMPGSIGDSDIFVVDVRDDGSFSEPKNLGPKVNTEKKEMFPFVGEKGLYFSSDGHTGLGGLDIFEASFDEKEGFHEVKNLGKPINSKVDDFSYIVNEETEKGFFASNRAGGKGDDDIYSFNRPFVEEIPVNKNAIAGVITEQVTGTVMPEALIQLFDANHIKLKETRTADDGSFIFEDLEGNTKYILKTVHDTYFDDEQQIATKENEIINVDISLRKLEEMIAVEDGIKKLKTEIIHFDFDRSHIRKDAAKELDKLVKVMKEHPAMTIKIESHTDSRGSKVYNEYLSDLRAKTTRDYIIAQGIAAERIESAIGYGENRLLNECDGTIRCAEETHYKNRRSEFIITNM